MNMINSENKVLIITGGYTEETVLKNLVMQKQYKMIIAVDRGLTAADAINLPLDFIVGDFDSVSKSLLEKYQEASTCILSFPPEKDKTDTQIAIELAIEKGATSIDLVGATGSRMDHMLANIHMLMIPLQKDINAYIIDQNNRIYLKKRSFTLKKCNQYGDYVSLLPFSEQIHGLTLKGFKYPLNYITLEVGSSLGISNEIVEDLAFIEFTDGILVVIEARD